MTQSIYNNVKVEIAKYGRGSIFFSSDFIPFNAPKSVAKSLERLTNDGKIIRIARGIYYSPKINKVLKGSITYPTMKDIAIALAKRDNAKIVPTGDYALCISGLSTHVATNLMFLTVTPTRRIKVYDKYFITFKRVSPKRIAFKNEVIMLLVFALREIGEGNVSNEQFNKLKSLLEQVSKELIDDDIRLIPAWIKNVIAKCYE